MSFEKGVKAFFPAVLVVLNEKIMCKNLDVELIGF